MFKTQKKKKKYFKYKIIILIILGIFSISLSLSYIDKLITPMVKVLGELRAQEITIKSINESTDKIISKKDTNYENLIDIREDEDGNVTFMQANSMLMNKISSDVALAIQNHLNELESINEYIPIGNILGNQILSNFGPDLKLTFIPSGMVSVNFGTEFETTGINQTRHRIFLVIDTSIRMIMPFSSNTVNITTHFPIAETVIVGKVPMNYINVPKEEFLNITPIYEE